MKSRKIVWLGIGLLGVFVISNFFSPWEFETGYCWADELKIGVIYPMSGPMAMIGQECVEGLEVARSELNQKGGLLGKQVKYVIIDAPDAKAAVSAVERLVTVEKVKAIIGTYVSSFAFAATTIADKYGVVYLETIALAEDITQRGYKYVFRTGASGGMYSYAAVKCMAEYLAPKMGKKPEQTTMANVYEDSLFGQTMAKAGVAAAKKYGIKVVADEPYSAKSPDMTSTIVRLKAAKPDFLLHPGYLTDHLLFYRQAKELRFDFKTSICSGGVSMVAFGDGLGSDADGIQNVGSSFTEPNPFTKGFKEFMDMYKKEHGKNLNSTTPPLTYFGAKVLFQMIEKGGSLNADDIRRGALTLDIPNGETLVAGGVKFDPQTGQNERAFCTISQWQGGGKKLVTVWPEEAAVGKMIFPLQRWEDRK